MDGILNINKPRDLTSFDVVARVRRIIGERHAGHAGTLDPIATGVLPICLGKATRIIEYLFNETKTYHAEILLGVSTDTYDSTGKVLKTAATSDISRQIVEALLASYRGVILQTPPMFSAIKHRGVPLYKLARQGVEVERTIRQAHIYKLDLIEWRPPFFSLEVVCGKGTYIRSLAQDLGQGLGCGAIMNNLLRTRVGPFVLEESISLAQLTEIAGGDHIQRILFPLDYALQNFDALVINHEQQCALIHGQPISVKTIVRDSNSAVLSRAYNEEGSFIGMVEYDSANLLFQPHKIFLRECCQPPTTESGPS